MTRNRKESNPLLGLSDTDSDADVFNAKSANNRKPKSDVYLRSSTRRVLIISLLVLFVAATIVGISLYLRRSHVLEHTLVSQSVPLSVQTECGLVAGVKEITETEHKDSYAFKGIPYAKPPIADLRWRAPVRLSANKSNCWKGVFQADKFGSKCAQGSNGSEDCLYLNVFTPSLGKTSNLPVFVWIHGGYLMTGYGDQVGYSPDSDFVTSMNVVGVSMNYRLNAFGFLTLEELWQKDESYGNYGFMDQILVLEWVKRNIRNFGGNPNSVTICGQSSGGTSIYGLLASPMADGLFHKAIPMSGSPKFEKSYINASMDNTAFLLNSRCHSIKRKSDELRKCLYNLTQEEVDGAIPVQQYPYWGMEDLLDFPTYKRFDGALAVIDPIVVTKPPKHLEEFSFKFPGKVSVLIGNTAQEIGIEPVKRFNGPNATGEFHKFLKKRLNKFSLKYFDLVIGSYQSQF